MESNKKFSKHSHLKQTNAQFEFNRCNVRIFQNADLGCSVIGNSDHYSELTYCDWLEILDRYSFQGVDHCQLYYSVLKGIPDLLRMKVWMMIADTRNKGITIIEYVSLLKQQPSMKSLEAIKKDIPRSFVDNQKYLFCQPQLTRILRVASLRPQGYVQGMNFILLYVLTICIQSDRNHQPHQQVVEDMEFQRNVYNIFTYILDNMDLVFGSDPKGIFRVIAELENKISETHPEILYHIGKCGFECISLFSGNYFSLMMASKPPRSLAKSILDLFIFQGRKAIHSLIVSMLELCSDLILSINDPMDLQQLLKKDMFLICSENLLRDKAKASSIADFGIAFYQETMI